MAFGLETSLADSEKAGGIDPTTGLTIGDIMAKNASAQALQEQQVQEAIEKVRQARIGTQEKQAQFDAKAYLSEKGLMPKDQAMAQLKIALVMEQRPDDEIAQVMDIAETSLPETMDGRGLYQWWTTLQLPKYKSERTYPTDDDIRNVRVDSEGNPLQKDVGYMVDAVGSWHRSGLSKAESEMEEKLKHPKGASGDDTWLPAGVDENGRQVVRNKQGVYRFGNTTGIGDVPIYPASSTVATSPTRHSAETSATVISNIQRTRELIKEADAKGYIGPLGGRVGEYLAGTVGSTGNDNLDLTLGELRGLVTFLKSGAMKVHFGARGGQQMYDHFTHIFDPSKQSAAALTGALNAIEEFMKGYAQAPGVPKHLPTTIPPAATPAPAPAPAAAPAIAPAATSPTRTTANGTTYRVKKRTQP